MLRRFETTCYLCLQIIILKDCLFGYSSLNSPLTHELQQFIIKHPCEPKRGGHVIITHQMLASVIRVFHVIILPRSDKR